MFSSTLSYPEEINPLATVIGAKGSNIQLFKEYGVDTQILPNKQIKLESNDPTKIDKVKERIIDLIANSVSVFHHPTKIDIFFQISRTDLFKFKLYKEGIQNLYSLKKIGTQDVQKVLSIEQYSHYHLYNPEVVNELIEQMNSPKITIGRECFYNSKRKRNLDTRDTYTYSTFYSKHIGYHKDIKAKWIAGISSKQKDYLIQLITEKDFKLQKETEFELIEYLDLKDKQRVYSKKDLDGNQKLSYERDLGNIIRIVRIDGRPDIQIRDQPKNKKEVIPNWDKYYMVVKYTVKNYLYGNGMISIRIRYFQELDEYRIMIKGKDALSFIINLL